MECLENENLLGETNFEELQQTGKRNSCLKFLQEWDEEIKLLKLKLKERNDFYLKETNNAQAKLENEELNLRKRIQILNEINENVGITKQKLLEVEVVKVSKCNILEEKKHDKALKENELKGMNENLEKEIRNVNNLEEETAGKEKIEQDLEMLKEDVEAVQDRNTKLEKEIAKLSKVKQLYAECEQEKVNLLARMELLKNKNRNYLEDLKGHQDLLSDGNATLDKLKAKNSDFESDIDNLENVLDGLKGKKEETKLKYLRTKTISEELKTDIALKTSKKDQLLKELNKVSSESAALTGKGNALKLGFDIHKKERDNLQTGIKTYKSNNIEISQELTIKSSKLSKIKGMANDNEQKVAEIEKELKSKVFKINEDTEKISMLKDRNVEIDSERDSLKASKGSKEDELQLSNQKGEKLEEELKGLKFDLKNKEIACLVNSGADNEEISAKQRCLEEVKEKVAKAQEEIERFKFDEASKTSQIEDVNSAQKTEKMKLDNLKDSNVIINDEIEKLKESMNNLKTEINVATLKKAEHDEAHKNAKLKISSLEKERESLVEAKKSLNDKFKLMIDDKAKFHAEACRPLDEEWKSYNGKIEDLVESLRKVEIKIKTQDALNKKEAAVKLSKANSQEKEASKKICVLRKNLEELRRKIEHQNRSNSVLSRDVERLQVSVYEIYLTLQEEAFGLDM